jgi:hypothetical protein
VSSALHHIRLVAGFEVKPGPTGHRQIERDQCEALAAALAQDLARIAPDASQAMLVVGGSLLAPNELLRPGWPPWEALGDLARPVIRERGAGSQVLAIGAHKERLPDARLAGFNQSAGGQFLAIPMLLISDQDLDELRRDLEEKLFETGGVHPPARAALAQASALEIVHGQLLTLADLIALQHVQMDAAGLGGFWPVVEQLLLEPHQNARFDLPAGLAAAWSADPARVEIEFLSLDEFDGQGDDYALWLRALRSLCALLDAHRVSWHVRSQLKRADDGQYLIEVLESAAGPDRLSQIQHPDCGLVAWSKVEDGRQSNYYPLSSQGMRALATRFAESGQSAEPVILIPTTTSLKANAES